MNHHKTEIYFLFFLLALISVLTFFIFKPFLYVLVFAIVFATIFYGVYKKVLYLTRQNKGLAALITSIFVVLVVALPLAFVITQIFKEATVLYASVAYNGGFDAISSYITHKLNDVQSFISVPVDFSFNARQYFENGLNWLINNSGSIFSNAMSIAGSSLVFLFALYYLFKDGEKLKSSIITLSPLKDRDDETIFVKLHSAINSIVLGTLLMSVIQGALTAIGFFIFSIPNAVLWGTVATVTALIPFVGTAFIIIPAAIFLFLKGNIISGILFLAWGFVVVGLIDNFLRPKFIQRGMMIHPFFILLSAVGGIAFFGPVGFLLGPLVIGLLFVLLDIYSSVEKEV